jgi:prepilin-type N-terminal cleavage/methylation domain-containing protein
MKILKPITTQKISTPQSAFTLVELAIVLTIVGILVAGVVQGEKLISTYKTASVVSNFEKYKIAVDEFKKQYMALPGDLGDASAVFATPTAAGNGNDNNQIEFTSNNAEQFLAWQHLGRANLIKGSFTGTGGNANYVAGTNIPAGSHANSGYRIFYSITNSSIGTASTGFSSTHIAKAANFISYATFTRGCTTSCENVPVLSPEDAFTIDTKIDDGVPTSGLVYSVFQPTASSNRCFTGSGATGVYTVATIDTVCAMYYSLEN